MAKEKIKEEHEEEKKLGGNAVLKQILKANEEDHYNYQERVDWKISTGSLLLDMAIGNSLSPSLCRLTGAFGEGKSAQALEICRQFLITVPNSKVFWNIAEGRGLSKEHIERCGLKFVYKEDDWEIGTVFVLESNVYELFIKCVKDLVLSNDGVKYCFVVDSIDGLQLKNDRAKDIDENNKVAGAPALSKKMMQSLSLGMFKYGHLMLLLSQVTAEIKLDQYTKSPNRGGDFSGGNCLLHAADWIWDYQRTYNSDIILDNPNGKLNDGKSKPIGKYAKIIIRKSAIETSRQQLVQYPIKFGRKPSGIWLEYELCDLLSTWDLLTRAGSWYTLSEDLVKELQVIKSDCPSKLQGIESWRDYLSQNQEIVTFLVKKFKDMFN